MATQNTIQIPPVIFGTSALGNLYQASSYETKLAIVKACVENSALPMFDSAGKYGAGMALQTLGQCLRDLQIAPDKVLISNKLGWFQTPLTTAEPTFEQGVWVDINNDAVQKISYDGILECFYQGNELLNGYIPQMVSIHDPDEYLATAKNEAEEAALYSDILEAYKALAQLKADGKVKAIGVGSKQWKVIQRIANDVALDWVMIANSFTIHSHPKELVSFIAELHQKGVSVINSAVFNGGFLIGSDFYNYQEVDKSTEAGKALYNWREGFFAICKQFDVLPAEACFNFGFNVSGVCSIALNTTKPDNVIKNIGMATKQIPPAFWQAMVDAGLLEADIIK
jgi:D-threo-aldose 1-dehydrogenase